MNEKKTILIADDMSLIRIALRLNLENVGYKVILANDGREALKYAFSYYKRPDLIILDIRMPEMDGYEVIKKLRESDDTREIPVIFLTASSQKKDVLKGIELGGNDYMVKPYTFSVLHRKIEKLIGKNQTDK